MSEKELEELRQYNLEYLEALDKENLYDEDYTSAVELKYAKKEIERLNYKIKSIVYMCYESDMPYDEFKQVWVNAFDRIYDPNDVEILKKELKGSDKDE